MNCYAVRWEKRKNRLDNLAENLKRHIKVILGFGCGVNVHSVTRILEVFQNIRHCIFKWCIGGACCDAISHLAPAIRWRVLNGTSHCWITNSSAKHFSIFPLVSFYNSKLPNCWLWIGWGSLMTHILRLCNDRWPSWNVLIRMIYSTQWPGHCHRGSYWLHFVVQIQGRYDYIIVVKDNAGEAKQNWLIYVGISIMVLHSRFNGIGWALCWRGAKW